ncbi:envelope stress response protein PspG [Erwinia aphidicola]|uniref:Envelope stress response protein PspG n=1 Tax=Erwinia aphidicola TaxID=68334 RepID=A0ABU8DHG6_ERWAP|nr:MULTISPECIES: envelope stress response protein PspG [Erwinia]KMV68581.1 phage-shock protein [bacteria symbiont BFo1 of Frankliniella occidentalis]PIJ56278.1 phage shock protein G [Erwinia sp. OLMDLW33]VTT29183.1 inner membrane protein [Klebsiella pneumoniae]KYP83353.1 phage-shock protein [bacteria symbiont BFo1 of Frankliniella occidentalis]KYP88160.1 phage-shock protein [bacteria symbiont BFo1 of Frankliniella occidentalis]
MLEILFVIGFFLMLLLTGISLLGIIAALLVATVVMFVGGLFAIVIKLLPWLVVAVVAVWLYRALRKPSADDKPWLSR